jgi:hypothetical protein
VLCDELRRSFGGFFVQSYRRRCERWKCEDKFGGGGFCVNAGSVCLNLKVYFGFEL